jgi:broad specificity phosphatase PhoE
MLELLIIRHGETAWNTADIFRGRISIGLSEKGLEQVELLSQYLSSKNIRAIYCSPLQRAMQTAEAVARPYFLNVQPLPELTDLDFGEWEGKSRQEVSLKYPDIYMQWLDRPDLAVIPGGETLADARKRSINALDWVISQNTEGVVAIVTHRVVTKVLTCAMLGLDDSHFWNIEHNTCGVTTFVNNGKCFILMHHNDVSFLNKVGAAASGPR